jgi:carbon storage regulator CsrA
MECAGIASVTTCKKKELVMLVLSRKVGESILLPSHGVTIQVGEVKRGRVRLRITAPADTRILREEVAMREEFADDTEGGALNLRGIVKEHAASA